MLVFGRNLSSVVCFAFISLCRIAVGSSGCDEMIDPMNLLMAVRNYSEHPSSTSKPYVPVSFNIARDVFVGHLRGLHEILKMDLEVIIFRPTDSRTSMSPMHLKEVARYPIKEDEIKEDAKRTICDLSYSISNSVAVHYSRKPGKNSQIVRTEYFFSSEFDENPSASVYVKAFNDDVLYALTFESEESDEPVEISFAHNTASIEFMQKVYSVNLIGNESAETDLSLSFFHSKKSSVRPVAVINTFLLETDHPNAAFFGLAKYLMRNRGKFNNISRFSIKRFKQTKSYSISFLFVAAPTSTDFELIQRALRECIGPCTVPKENAQKRGNLTAYTSIRLTPSKLSLTVGNGRKFIWTKLANDLLTFKKLLAEEPSGTTYQISRTLLDYPDPPHFTALVSVPQTARRKLFEDSVAKLLFESNSRWVDQISSIEIKPEHDARHNGNSIALRVIYQFLSNEDRISVQSEVVSVMAGILEKFSGHTTFSGVQEIIELDVKEHKFIPPGSNAMSIAKIIEGFSESIVEEPILKKTSRNKRSVRSKNNIEAEQAKREETKLVQFETIGEDIENEQMFYVDENESNYNKWLRSLNETEFDVELALFSSRLEQSKFHSLYRSWFAVAYNGLLPDFTCFPFAHEFLSTQIEFGHVLETFFLHLDGWDKSIPALLELVNSEIETLSLDVQFEPIISKALFPSLSIAKDAMKKTTKLLLDWPKMRFLGRITFSLLFGGEHGDEVQLSTIIETLAGHQAEIKNLINLDAD